MSTWPGLMLVSCSFCLIVGVKALYHHLWNENKLALTKFEFLEHQTSMWQHLGAWRSTSGAGEDQHRHHGCVWQWQWWGGASILCWRFVNLWQCHPGSKEEKVQCWWCFQGWEKHALKLDFLKTLKSKAAKDAGAEEVAPGTPGGAGGSSGTR